MPEGPELHLASLFINRICGNRIFTGKVVKSDVSVKNPDIDWDEQSYVISSTARGKEIMLHLCAVNGKTKKLETDRSRSTTILFRFGMSGKFYFDPVKGIRKHAHLNFFTKEGDMVLSFVDYRRFGRWEVSCSWGKDRGPCVLTEYDLFRKNVLENLNDRGFNRPICEALLNQKFFNGIGNYLRAEILFRCKVPPFDHAKTVLEGLATEESKVKVKCETPDILELCHLLPQEVINLSGATGFEVDPSESKDATEFANWLQCYYNPSMKNMVDHNGRTIWFSGPPGRMVPAGAKSKKRKQKTHLDKTSGTSEPQGLKMAKKKKKSVVDESRVKMEKEDQMDEVSSVKDRKLTRGALKEEVNSKSKRQRSRLPATAKTSKEMMAKEETLLEDGRVLKGKRKTRKSVLQRKGIDVKLHCDLPKTRRSRRLVNQN